MIDFQNMHLSVFRSKRGKNAAGEDVIEGMVSLHARDHVDGDAPRESEYGRSLGLNYLSFYFTQKEFEDIFQQRTFSANDIGHNVRAAGEHWTFYDLEFSAKARGMLQVPFVVVEIPYIVQRILLRMVRRAWAKCVPDGDRIEIVLPMVTRQRWLKTYGCGKGEAKLKFREWEDRVTTSAGEQVTKTQAFMLECEAAAGEKFKERVESLLTIARNQTIKRSETAHVEISKDWDGFYFQILRPDGKRTMNGGLINHGRDGQHDWSIHM
jgi:hypothetical protein